MHNVVHKIENLRSNYRSGCIEHTLVYIIGTETVYYQVRALPGPFELDNVVFAVIVRL